LIRLLFPDEIASAEDRGETWGIEKGVNKLTEDFIHQFSHVLSKEDIQQIKGEAGIMEATR